MNLPNSNPINIRFRRTIGFEFHICTQSVLQNHHDQKESEKKCDKRQKKSSEMFHKFTTDEKGKAERII